MSRGKEGPRKQKTPENRALQVSCCPAASRHTGAPPAVPHSIQEQEHWCSSRVAAAREAEAGGPLEPRSLKRARAMSNVVRSCVKK